MTYIAHPTNKAQETALKAIFEAMEIPYEKKEEEYPYDPEFVAKIKRGEEDRKAGKGRKITIEELDNLWK